MTLIAVTGATGFIGRQLCTSCLDRGYQLRTPSREQLERSDSSIYAGVDAIVHLAGRAHVVKEKESDPAAVFRRVNVELSERICRHAIAAGVRRFVFVSSIGVHGTHSESAAFSSSDLPAPKDAYARSKLEAERLLTELCASNSMELVIVRPTLVAGALAPGNLDRLARLIRRGLPIPVISGDARRHLVGLQSLCELLCLAAVHPAAPGTTLLAADDPALTAAEMAMAIADGIGRPARLIRLPAGLLRPLAHRLGRERDFTRLSSPLLVDAKLPRVLLGWRTPLDIREELAAVGRAVLDRSRAKRVGGR